MKQIKSSFFSSGILLCLFLTLFCFFDAEGNASLRCSQCRRLIRGRYIRYRNEMFCSRRCQTKVMPRCAHCRKVIEPGRKYLISKKKPYCSRKCLSYIMPECTVCSRRSFNGGIYAGDHSYFACPDCMKLPRCFACTIPVRGGKRLADGRNLCRKCLQTSVYDQHEALQIFRQVRRTLRERLNISSGHRIHFSLVNQSTLHRLSVKSMSRQGAKPLPPSVISTEQGLFRFDGIVREYKSRFSSKTVRRELANAKYSVYVLDHLPRERMEYVMAHELAHDYLSAHFPGIRIPWIQEGFSEYIGYLYNRLYGRTHLNIRLEKNPDPVYGEGFRRIRSIAEKESFEGLKRFLRSQQNRK